MEQKSTFHEELKQLMDEFVMKVYSYTKDFPRDELYGLTSQLRRAALSIILNYIEGYARQRIAVLKNFLEISYGSLKEVEYLIDFSYKEKYINVDEFQESQNQLDQIGKMLWVLIKQ